MKRVIILLIPVLFFSITSCSDSANNEETVSKEGNRLKGFERLDLNEWGYAMSIMVPSDEGEPEVTLMESGSLEIIVGQNFGIEINYGEGDLALLKSDLQNDLVFTSTIVSEDENTIVYSQNIENSGVKTQNHFFHRAVLGTDTYEIKDLARGEYGEKMIEKMLDAAKSLATAAPAAV